MQPIEGLGVDRKFGGNSSTGYFVRKGMFTPTQVHDGFLGLETY